MKDWLTDERKTVLLGMTADGITRGLGFLVALWVMAALVVGSVVIGQWIARLG